MRLPKNQPSGWFLGILSRALASDKTKVTWLKQPSNDFFRDTR
jgi:hypothetical protein